MKKIILFAAATAILAACTSDDLATDAQQQTAQDEAVTFDAYMLRTTTRAGATGPLTTDSLTTAPSDDPSDLYLGHHYQAGFGVFAYYTDNFDYTPVYTPNFMYNEQVKYNTSTSAFGYTLTKYWPNEHGSAASSADMDRVSFFAYAPYVEVEPSTGMVIKSGSTPYELGDDEVQWGITGMKRNTLQGDPLIQYIASFEEDKSVDLCWGTTGATGADDVTWKTNGSTQTIKAGYPWLNVRKPEGAGSSSTSKVSFVFQHATAQLYVTVKTDNTTGWTDISSDTNTKVWVRSIRFTGIAQKAALNLNNPKTVAANKARWIDYYGANELEMGESVTVYDGRKDGSEGIADAVAANETVLGINPAFIQDENQLESDGTGWVTGGTSRTGVTKTATNLFCNGVDDKPVYVIPTGEKVTVEIVYDIETVDAKLPVFLSDGTTPGSTVENRISKAITFGTETKFENGKSYTLNLILGMKDVKFNASVNETWGTTTSGTGYLPNND